MRIAFFMLGVACSSMAIGLILIHVDKRKNR